MQKILIKIIAALTVIIVATACPVGIDHAPDTPGNVKIDKRLIGAWATANKEAAIQKIVVKKLDETTYAVEVTEKSDNFLADETKYSSWLTEIDGQQFIYSKPASGKNQYFTYHLKIDGKDQFTISDVGLLDKGVDGVTSTRTFREEISRSLKMKDCLTEPVAYTREK